MWKFWNISLNLIVLSFCLHIFHFMLPLNTYVRPSDMNLHLHICTSWFYHIIIFLLLMSSFLHSFYSCHILFPSFDVFSPSSSLFQHVQGKTLGIHNSEKTIYMCKEIRICQNFLVSLRNLSRLFISLEAYAAQCNPLPHGNKLLTQYRTKVTRPTVFCQRLNGKGVLFFPWTFQIFSLEYL